MKKKTVLIIEDDSGITELVSECFADAGFAVVSKSKAADAINWLVSSTPNLMVLDYGLPDMNGREFIHALKDQNIPVPPFIVFTGQGGELIATEMMKLGARDYIIKDSNFLGVLPEIIKHIEKEIENEEERKKAEAELMKLSSAIHQSPVNVFITDKLGNIEFVNPRFCEITGYSPEEVMGKNPSFLRSETQDETIFSDLWNTILTGKSWKGELHNRKKNGELFWEDVVISPIQNEQGITTHIVSVAADITDKKKILTDLQAAKDRAEESDRLKSAFLANMSHEIRTPLNAIVGFSNLIGESNLTSETKKTYNEIIQANTSSLLVLIDDIIDLSRIEASRLVLNYADFNVIDVFNDLAREHKNPKASGVIFLMDDSLKIPSLFVHGDATRFRQILNNLVSNALKYTEQGTVTTGLSAVSDNAVSFFVRDTGIGISREDQAIVFDRFRKVDNPLSQKYSGAGLGLTITKKLVELMGGHITLESTPGEGSVFSFSIPLSLSHPYAGIESYIQAPQPASDKPRKIMRVAVAEDSDDNYILLEILLSQMGFKSIRYCDGKQISDHFLALEKPDVDLVLMDIRMPVMDGFEATRLILGKFPKLPIIAQTAHAMVTDLEKISREGFAEILTKPFSLEKLSELVLKTVQ